MIRRPPRSTRTDTLFPYTTLFRSLVALTDNPIDSIWRNRPPPCPAKLLVHPDRYSGKSSTEKRQEIAGRSEEHTSELQSLMRISYAVFCLKKKKIQSTKSANTAYLITRNHTHQTHYRLHNNV